MFLPFLLDIQDRLFLVTNDERLCSHAFHFFHSLRCISKSRIRACQQFIEISHLDYFQCRQFVRQAHGKFLLIGLCIAGFLVGAQLEVIP